MEMHGATVKVISYRINIPITEKLKDISSTVPQKGQ
jgi:hypothetical protein